jgi:hypothetical protein
MPFQPLQQFNGLLARMAPQDNYGGLLTPQDQRAAANQYRATLAAGLLSAAGPQRMPVSLGQAIGAAMPHAQQARDYRAETGIRNEQLRRQIDNENRQNAARTKIGGLFRTAGGPEGEMLGLLAEFDPGLAMQVAMNRGQERADPNVIRALELAGIDPASPEGQEIVIKSLTGGNDTLAGIQAQIAALNAKGLERDQAREAQTEHEERVGREQGIVRALDQTQKIAKLTKELEGTALASGLPGAEWRRAGVGALAAFKGVIGLDTDDMRAKLAAFDEQKKNLSDQLNNLISTGALENVTDSKLRQYQNSLADQNTQPSAIMEIQSVIAQSYLDQADRMSFKVPNREQYEAAIEEMENYVPPGTETVIDAPAIGRRVSEIGRMSAEQLNALASSGIEMTEEMIDAAEARWNEINAR